MSEFLPKKERQMRPWMQCASVAIWLLKRINWNFFQNYKTRHGTKYGKGHDKQINMRGSQWDAFRRGYRIWDSMIQICKDFSHRYCTRQMDGTVFLVSVGWRVPRTFCCIFGRIAVSRSCFFRGFFQALAVLSFSQGALNGKFPAFFLVWFSTIKLLDSDLIGLQFF